MKRSLRSLFNNWHIKLACLAAATLIWLFIKHNIAQSEGSASAPDAVLPAE